MFEKILTLFRIRKKRPILVCGSEYRNFLLTQKINEHSAHFTVRYVITDEPWQHKTIMCGAELRYLTEMLPLIEKHAIETIVCTEIEDLEKIKAEFEQKLQVLNCKLWLEQENLPLNQLEAELLRI